MPEILDNILEEKEIQVEEPKHLRLSELTKKIDNALKAVFASKSFWVIADITSHTFKANTKYHYFDLVEKDEHSTKIVAKVCGKAWGSGSNKIAIFEKLTGQKFTNNINVLLKVSVEYHAEYGLSLSVIDIDPNFTLGVLEQQKQHTLARLVSENPQQIWKVGDTFVTKNKQLKLNRVIQRIAIISSNTAAGCEDFKDSLNKNQFGYFFEINDYFCKVQGADNANQLVEKLIEIFNSKIPYDAVILTRGGGAQTDLLLFDTYNIGRAIARFPIPIITGIGHRKNETIADLMAHTSTKTPTMAAEVIIAHNRAFEDAILGFQKGIIIKTQQIFSSRFQGLANLNSIIVNQTRNILNTRNGDLVRVNQVTINTTKSILYSKHRDLTNLFSQISSTPKIIVSTKLNDLNNILKNIKAFNSRLIRDQGGYLAHFNSVVKMMSPANILNKGFAIVKVDDKITSNPDKVTIGKTISIVLADQEITTTVKNKKNYDGNDFNI